MPPTDASNRIRFYKKPEPGTGSGRASTAEWSSHLRETHTQLESNEHRCRQSRSREPALHTHGCDCAACTRYSSKDTLRATTRRTSSAHHASRAASRIEAQCRVGMRGAWRGMRRCRMQQHAGKLSRDLLRPLSCPSFWRYLRNSRGRVLAAHGEALAAHGQSSDYAALSRCSLAMLPAVDAELSRR